MKYAFLIGLLIANMILLLDLRHKIQIPAPAPPAPECFFEYREESSVDDVEEVEEAAEADIETKPPAWSYKPPAAPTYVRSMSVAPTPAPTAQKKKLRISPPSRTFNCRGGR